MSRVIQIRRGTAAEHETFTGADGEITMDTTNKTLRVHDGQTTGGTPLARADEIPDLTAADYVVAWQMPTADNGNTWYRKYRSGWVEMGGVFDIGGDVTASNLYTVLFPLEMADTTYTMTASPAGNTAGGQFGAFAVVVNHSATTTSGAVYIFKTETSYRYINWHVCGCGA